MSPEVTSSSEVPRVPAIEGWFTLDDSAPALIGSRCTTCRTYVFPPTLPAGPNPDCPSTSIGIDATFETVKLSRRGRIWSYTDSRYEPPHPYVAADPYVPFCLAAVELDDEKLVVLGQVAPGFTVDDLHVGMEVELVLGKLNSGAEGGTVSGPKDEPEVVIWNWRPVTVVAGPGDAAARAGTDL
jgi:uncharacterized OB-fold protein